MKKLILIAILTSSLLVTRAQIGLSYHLAGATFFGVNYIHKDRISTEVRIGANIPTEYAYGEVIATYIFIQNEDFQAYAGIGATSGPPGFDGGGVLPLGMDIYPFDNKRFGITTEAALLIVEEGIIRGLFGVRYRFLKD